MPIRSSVLGAVTVLVAAALEPAFATYPGANGKIAWTSTVDPGTPEARTAIFVDTVPLTNPLPGENHSSPSWSADGSKLVFVSVSPSLGARIETIHADGTGRQVIVNTTQLGLSPPSSPIWSRDGQRIFFRIAHQDPGVLNDNRQYRIFYDGYGGPELIQNGSVGSDIDLSPQGLFVYRRSSGFTPPPNELFWSSPSGNVHAINIPNQLSLPTVDAPVWMPDGDTIVFRAIYSIMENGAAVQRTEWFKIRRDETGLEQLTKAEDACPAPGLQPDFFADGAAPSPDGDLIVLHGSHAVLDSFEGNICRFSYTNGLWGIRSVRNSSAPPDTPSGGPPRLVHPDQNASGRPSWQPKPAGLIVKIDDGRGNPLEGLKVEIYDAAAPPGSEPLEVVPENATGGSYGFDVPFGNYRVRATLVDVSLPGLPSFEMHYAGGPDQAVWLEKTVFHQLGVPVPRFSFDDSTGPSNVPEGARTLLTDIANIYFRTKQYVNWVRANLTAFTGDKARIYTFAASDPDGNQLEPLDMFYNADYQAIYMGPLSSLYSDRNGGAEAHSPENGEWHEFSHHLFRTFIVHHRCAGPSHGGYRNPDTCDSTNEGFASFLPTLAAQSIEGVSDSDFDNRANLEQNIKAWDVNSKGGSDEDLAFAALLWDLTDNQADVEPSEVVGANGAHHLVTYQDTISLPLEDLWGRLLTLDSTVPSVYDLRQTFGTVAPTRDLDGDDVPDVAPIDEVFLMHGFYPVQGDQLITPAHKTYHFDLRGGVFNTLVSRTDHDYLDMDGILTSSLSPRYRLPMDPGANVEVSVRDASGTPLAGATVRLTVDDSTPPHTIERRLEAGDAAEVHLELAPYFSYLLPTDAPELPPCDPLNDHKVNVVVTGRINGYDSADTFTFDNCAYWHAIEASTSSTALSFTMTFPEDSTPPLSAVQAVATAPPTNGATLGVWKLQLSCSDPVTGGFASGCYRTEYRINGGPITTYTRVLELTAPGTYVVEFRSVDGAANVGAFQSATYTVLPQQDTDGDGLPDAFEITYGTNPNSPDTDGDGLSDSAELTRGTNPTSADTDLDGMNDSAEVAIGTDPLRRDTDGDGLQDPWEIGHGLDPLNPDTDGDTHLDGADNCPSKANRVQLDSDLDLVGDLCDVCPDIVNNDQTDADGDGAGDPCDCAPGDPLVRAPGSPTLAASKSGGSTIVLSWPPVAGADEYSVTVGTRAGLAVGDFGTCVGSTGGLSSFQSTQVPAPGVLLTYLVQGQSFTCGMGSLGFGVGETRRTNVDPAACQSAQIVERRSLSGTVVFGTFVGDHTATHAAGDDVLRLTETLSSGGSPASRFSRLEYRFTFDVAPGQRIQLLVKGLRNQSADGDDFRFEWSTNGTSFTPVTMESLPVVNDGTFKMGELPPTLAGNITLRVVDTNHTAGTQDLDWMWIDSLLVRSISP